MRSSKKNLFSIIFSFFAFLPVPAQEGFVFLDENFMSLFEKVELEELPPAPEYYVDDSPLKQILKLLDEEDIERQKAFLEQKKKKIIKSTGSIEISSSKYAQNSLHEYLARYMTDFGKENLYKILDEGEAFRLYVRREIERRGLPKVLEYLPVVESEYKATAKSRSGARGLWQFMENSMSPFLKKNEWFDERLDPWKSTDAALSKLSDNYKMFGDWLIAIAAYNCGAGAMKKALKKAKHKDFWYLAKHSLLPKESCDYIPKLLAICEIAENGEEYLVPLPPLSQSSRYADFDYLTTKEEISLKRLAHEIRLDSETLRKLNTALLHEKTPPNEEYRIRLPEGMYRSAKEALDQIFETSQAD